LLYATSTDVSCYDKNFTKYSCAVTERTASTTDGAIISSGGGFSNLFERPSYQDQVVTNYLNLLSTDVKNKFNTTGRAYPDVSTLGHNIPIIYGGKIRYYDGTSASAPFFAGMITLLNDIRLSQGKPSLGFINPLLYSLDPSYFNDIIKGGNACVPDECTGNGFDASTGWDPVTGLGSPIFSKLSDYILSLPANPSFSTSSTSSSSPDPSFSPSPASTSTTTGEGNHLCGDYFMIVILAMLIFM